MSTSIYCNRMKFFLVQFTTFQYCFLHQTVQLSLAFICRSFINLFNFIGVGKTEAENDIVSLLKHDLCNCNHGPRFKRAPAVWKQKLYIMFKSIAKTRARKRTSERSRRFENIHSLSTIERYSPNKHDGKHKNTTGCASAHIHTMARKTARDSEMRVK